MAASVYLSHASFSALMPSSIRSSGIPPKPRINEGSVQGYGREALLLMLEYGFGILNLHRIELEAYSYNERALHVYEGLGFKKEGVRREALYYDHEYHDIITMSLLEEEYRKKFRTEGQKRSK